MAIKIDGNNLYRRVWNGQDVQRVILNGSQIRPTEEKHIDYHVISDFSGGHFPGGWGGNGVYPVQEGMTVETDRQSGTVSYTSERGMPSLANAKKVEIVVNYVRDHIEPLNHLSVLDVELMNTTGQTIVPIRGGTYYTDGDWRQVIESHTLMDYADFSGAGDGNYTTSILIDMEDEENAYSTINSEGVSPVDESEISITQAVIAEIRSCNYLNIQIRRGIIIKSVDFYVWNKETVPPTPVQERVPEGFHVPTVTDLQDLYDIVHYEMGISDSDFIEYLHIPIVTPLSPNDGLPEEMSEDTFRWASDFHDGRAWGRWMGNSRVSRRNETSSYGACIRPFKDTVVFPDNTWTVEYHDQSGAGIYWSESLGLITIMLNGGVSRRDIFTISDKNLGATEAWSLGDNITESNGGLLYQWGNCYGFPMDGAESTSSTRVDTTGYGDGNLYTSDRFITSGFYDWMNPVNDTLWS